MYGHATMCLAWKYGATTYVPNIPNYDGHYNYDLIKVGGVWENKVMAHNIPTINHLYYK